MSDSIVHRSSDPHSTWSTTNAGEAMPGVMKPLGWSVFGPAVEAAVRWALGRTGVLSQSEAAVPRRCEDWQVSAFYGRFAIRVDFWCEIGDRLPGTSGTAVAEQWLGSLPEGFVSRPTRRRYPTVIAKAPRAVAPATALVRQARVDTQSWWANELRLINDLSDLEATRRHFSAAVDRFHTNMRYQTLCNLMVVQPVFDRLVRLSTRFDGGEALMAGYGGHEETKVVEDLWSCSRDALSVDTFLTRHGYHGPAEGDISSLVWREDRSPLIRILDSYRSMADGCDPVEAEAKRARERKQAEAQLLARLSPGQRADARIVLSLARRFVPYRAVGKVAFLQSLDVARAAARRHGALLAERAIIDQPDDVFFFSAEELAGRCWLEAAGEIAERKRRHHEYARLDLPNSWRGLPTPTTLTPASEAEPTSGLVIEGIGASPGVAEGRVRVIEDPATADVQPGEILVAHTTDPSWASVMFVSSALVIDIGGLLSHAAVVARELAVPCVCNAATATRRLRTGDLCRVDGTTGRVELLERPDSRTAKFARSN